MKPVNSFAGNPFRKITLAACLSLSSVLWSAEATTSSAEERRPNFIVILVDDLGQRDLGCYGSTFYETPNIDKLASEGVRFTQAYAACPVCSPSRAGLLTGKYPVRMQTTDWFGAVQPGEVKKGKGKHGNTPLLPAPYREDLPHEEVTVAETLKKNGYSTFIAGKWHLGKGEENGPEKHGFDINIAGNRSGHPKSYFSPYSNPDLPDGPKKEHLTDRLASETVTFIEDHKDKPFFVYLPFYAVHTPLQAPPDLVKKYEKKRERLGLGDETVGSGNETARAVQSHPVYAAMVESMDTAVGTVVDAVDRLGLDDNTMIIFTSDNGGLSTKEGSPTSNEPLRAGKGWLYEGGVRVAFIARGPFVGDAGSTSSAVVSGTDIYPTLLEMAGLPLMPEQHQDGVSLAGLLKDNSPLKRDAIYWHYPHYGNQGSSPGSAVRAGDWKLIKWYEKDKPELFNLAADPHEKKDVAGENPEKVKELSQMLDEWLKETGAVLPTANPNYQK